MLPRYIIHIGPLKTGSTYLQQSLTEAAGALAEKGVSYPKLLSSPNEFMHMGVYRALRKGDTPALKAEFARVNANGHETVILSCEHFIFFSPSDLHRLADATGAGSVQFVYASRRWSDRLTSLWNQSLFMGGVQLLPEFYLSFLSDQTPDYYPRFAKRAGAGPADLDYSVVWQGLVREFGRDALTIFPYSNITDAGEDVFVKFCQDIIGLDKAPETSLSGKRLWASMPPADQEMLRVLNDIHLRRTGEKGGKVRGQFIRQRDRLDTALIGEAIAPSVREILIDDSAPQFTDVYARMSEYSDRVTGGGAVFARKAKAAKHVLPSYLLEPGVAEAFQVMYRAIESGLASGN